MAIPKAYFNYIPQPTNFLQVVFKDISTNVPTSWLWDFGDGQTSTSQNPTNTYAANGFYTVTFTATNGDGSDQTIINIGVSSAGLVLPQSIQALIDDYIPQGITIDPIIKNDSIRKWQLYLQPLVCPLVSADDTYDEFAYIPLANQLVAKLVAFDIIINGASAYLMSLGPQNGQSGRETKKIVTGPTEAEWFSNSDVWSSVMGEGGAFDTLRNECCTLASRLRIYLPFCDPLTYSPIIPMKHCPPPPAPAADPFGIN